MLKRFGLLCLAVGIVALLGVSIVFAQQGTPAGENAGVVPPQATPGPIVDRPSQPPSVDSPRNPSSQPDAPQNLPPNNNQVPQNLPPVAPGVNIMIANIPADLLPVPEMKPLPAPPGSASITAMTAVGPDLRPVSEGQPATGAPAVSMTLDAQNPPVQEMKPLPVFGAPATSAGIMNTPSPDLVPVPERR